MLQFDENGHLFPYVVHETTLDEMRQVFVDAFPESETRKRLFDNYLDWIFDFQRDVFPYFTQWIDGSFVTQKLNPKDIDFVTFLDWKVYEIKEKRKELDRFWSFSNEKTGLDAYIIPTYPPDVPEYENTLRIKRKWKDLYSRIREKNVSENAKKGFLLIQFEKL
jgi:hypothetical protein